MNILMIYWNAVWAHSAPAGATLFHRHSLAEELAFARALKSPRRNRSRKSSKLSAPN